MLFKMGFNEKILWVISQSSDKALDKQHLFVFIFSTAVL